MELKICSQCGKELPLTEYYSNGKGGFRAECKECHKKYVLNQYKERKSLVNEIKAEYKCQKCGESRFYVLDFHHKDPSIKDNTIARMTANSTKIENILKEIDKCAILCSNCHREFHYLENQSHITIEQFLLQS